MKALLALGGLIGFGMGLGLGLAYEKSLPSALVHACVATCIGALLLRWWGRVWLRGLQQAGQEQNRG